MALESFHFLRPAWLLFDPSTRTFGGTPGDDDVDTLMIRVIATDPGGLSVSDVFDLAVANVDDNPTANPDTGSVIEAGVVDNAADPGTPMDSGNVLDNDEDPDLANPVPDVLVVNQIMFSGGGNIAVPAMGTAESVGNFGRLTIGSDGEWSYALDDGAANMLAQGATVDEVFTYRISDGAGPQSTSTLTITITGANDAPVAVDFVGLNTVTENVISVSRGSPGVLTGAVDPDAKKHRQHDDVHDVKGNALYGYVTLKDSSEGRNQDNLRKEINQLITDRIGPIAKLDKIQFTAGLPKTRSGKIMRRILRKIAANEHEQLGDTSTLADPSVVDTLIEERLNK